VVALIHRNKRGNPLAALALTPVRFEEDSMTRDPRSEAEKARAALARNSELGMAVPESPLEREPSVTPETFGEHRDGESLGETTENARVRPPGNWTEDEVAASRDVGDSTGTMATSRDIPVDPAHVVAPPTRRGDEEDDVLSRAKE
jgi:hypothetical protein